MTTVSEVRARKTPPIDITVTGLVHRAVSSGDLKNRSGSWAIIPLLTRTPAGVRNGRAHDGDRRYLTVKVFGPLATKLRENPPAVGRWITIQSGNFSASTYRHGETSQARGSLDLIASAVEVYDDIRSHQIDVKIVGFVSRAVRSGEFRRSTGSWAQLPLITRTPDEVRDGETTPGYLRYPTVKAFGELATTIRDAPPSIGTYVRVVSHDLDVSVYHDRKTGQPRAGTELTAHSLEIIEDDRVPAEIRAAQAQTG